jgi:hypothetical protein
MIEDGSRQLKEGLLIRLDRLGRESSHLGGLLYLADEIRKTVLPLLQKTLLERGGT